MAKDKAKRRKSVAVMVETPERARHAAGVIDRPTGVAIGAPVGRLVQSPIDRLIARGSITKRMHTAGARLRGDFEIGVMGARDSDGELPPGIRSTAVSVSPGEAQLDALSAFRAAGRCLGPHVGMVVIGVCCYEHDVSVIAAQQGQGRHEVMGVLKAGLRTLADHYGLTGKDDATQNVDATGRHVA
jgi:hypothetical protein